MSTSTTQRPAGALPTVRRITVYILLFTLVTLTAIGLSGLITLALDASLEDRGTALAQSLAFTLVAGPLTWLLWRSLAKRLHDPAEAAAPAWGLYLAAMYTTALITSSIALLDLLSYLIASVTNDWAESAGRALAWGTVWFWHAKLWHHRDIAPRTLATLPGVLGNWYGLALAWGALAAGLGALFTEALISRTATAQLGTPWYINPLSQLPWLAGGLLIWWWHFTRERIGSTKGGFADVALVLGAVFAAATATLGGAGVALHALLRVAFGAGAQALNPLPAALSAALAGALVWAFHLPVVRQRAEPVRAAARLVLSGIGLAAAASGLGIVVNAALAGSSRQLAGYTSNDLLLAGLVALVLGALLWFPAWRPDRSADPRGRRVYLVAVFGISAVVALIALLVIGFRLFEQWFDAAASTTPLIEDIRAPLGLLIATALAAGYHFMIWRADRELIEAQEPAPEPTAGAGTLESLVLVAGGDTGALRELLTKLTGARVEVMAIAGGQALPHPDEAALATALAGIDATVRRAMLLIDGPGDIRVIELEPVGELEQRPS